MRNITKAIAIAAMLAFPVASFAQTAPAATKAPAAKAEKSTSKKMASHTTKGTVKSVSDSQLVISTGSGKAAKDETFVVNASTTKTGTIETGAHVSVHYTTEGSTMTATTIAASAPKAAKSSTKKK